MESNILKHEKITRNWGGKRTQEEFELRIDKWIEQFEECDKEFVCSFLYHFKYFTLRAIKDRVAELFESFQEAYKTNLDNLVFIPAYKELGVGFSDTFFNDFWYVNNLYDYAEKNVYNILEKGVFLDQIVIVDDYSGSGKTIKRTINKCIEANEEMKNSTFYILTLQMSKLAKEKLKNFSENNSIHLEILTLRLEDKAFLGNKIFPIHTSEDMKNKYLGICDYKKIGSDFKLGFDDTEALLAFEYNTPNNTLGLFWKENKEYKALFKRHKKKKTTLNKIKQDLKTRKKEKDEDFIKKYEVNEQYVYLMRYLIKEGKSFNYSEALVKFGINENQLDEAMNYLRINGYITYNDSKLIVTEKLKKYIKTSKLKSYTNVKSNEENVVKEYKKDVKYTPKNFGKKFKGYNN